MMPFELGCKFTLENFWTGAVGAAANILLLPSVRLDTFKRANGEWRFHAGLLGRIVFGGIFGCVADCTTQKAFFAGFFSWHLGQWLQTEAWQKLRGLLRSIFGSTDRR